MSLEPVLYAEDEENDAFFLERAFGRSGIDHPLIVVRDGQEAIDYCLGAGRYSDRQQHPFPCLMLLDLNLPRKSGLEVLQTIRPKFTLPVVVFTSSLHEEDIHRAYLQGANAYVVKPSRFEDLTETMRSFKDFWFLQNRFDRKLGDFSG